jgi:hypothetical protein
MTARSLLLLTVLALTPAGCLRNQTRTEDDRARGASPASRLKEKYAKAEPKPAAAPPPAPNPVPPRPDETPVVPVEFMKAPVAVPSAGPEAIPTTAGPSDGDEKPDFPRPIRNFIQRRREDKADAAKPDPKPEDKPAIPSPFAKDRKNDAPRGVEFPSPEAKAPDVPSKMTPGTPAPTKPVAPPPGVSANSNFAEVKDVHALAKQKWDALKDFEAKLVRKEVIGGKDNPAEEMIFRFRKEPYSIYTKNVGRVGHGRELLYVQGPGAKVHVLTGEGDNRLVGAGFYAQFAPDDRMITSKSRHKVTDGAVNRTVDLLGKAIAATEAGQFDGLKSMGQVKRKEYADPVAGIEATIPPGQDKDLPRGGKREVYFDANPNSPSYGLPVLIRLLEGDRELEYYAFTDFKVPANFTNADFDPARMQKKR